MAKEKQDGNPQAHESELDKARGQTESQQQLREYHEGEYQDTDPVTGLKRGRRHPLNDPSILEAPPEEEQARLEAEQEAARRFNADQAKDSQPARRPSAAGRADVRGGNANADATDAARELADDEGIDLSAIRGSGENGRIVIGDVRDAVAARDGK